MMFTAALSMLLGPAPFVVGDLRTSGDWTVGCDNRMACHATSHPEESYVESEDGPVADGSMSVSVKAAPVPGESPVVEFALLEGSDPVPSPDKLEVVIDGLSSGLRIHGDRGLFRLEGADAQAFAVAASQGRKVALLDAAGNEIAAASLSGMKEAMTFIDSQQSRTGTIASLAEPGPKPWDSAVIPAFAPVAPIIVAAKSGRAPTEIGAEAIAQLEALDPCADASSDPRPETPRYFRLDEDHSLLILATRCGGYNPYRMLFIIDEEGHTTPARFWPFPGIGIAEDPDLPDPGWDEKERRLKTFGRGRVLADCGEAAEYVWDRGAFRLVHFSSLYPCRGSYDYITTYQVPVVVAADSGGPDGP